jgi:hypothetical protein
VDALLAEVCLASDLLTSYVLPLVAHDPLDGAVE